MSNLGIGAMLHELAGDSPKSAADYYGRTVKKTAFDKAKNELCLTFDDGVTVRLWDSRQSCCESRYMTCDDEVNVLEGGKLLSIEVAFGGGAKPDYGEHEVAFLKIVTNNGTITVATHNEHNGYYGGFELSLDEVREDAD
jgi:hypothetical protein